MSENKILYHYTSFDSLCKIIGDWNLKNWSADKNKMTVWATDIRYLNDATEFRYGFDIAKRIYHRLSETDIVPNIEDSTKIRGFLKRASRDNLGSQTYTFSLSENGDLLSQWRAYCPNGGVSIGFSERVLKRIAEQQSFKLVKCSYYIKDQEEEIEQVLKGQTKSDEPIKDFSSFFNIFMRTIASFKHPTFKEEVEFRLVSQSKIPISSGGSVEDEPSHETLYKAKWRGSQSMPIRYTELSLSGLNESELKIRYPELSQKEASSKAHYPFTDSEDYEYGASPVREIKVGPSARQDLVCSAVQDLINDRMFLQMHGDMNDYPESRIKAVNSEIPYRSN